MSQSCQLSVVFRASLLCAITVAVGALSVNEPSQAKHVTKEPATGEQLYKQHCAQCHANGGNSVNPAKPLAESKELNSLPGFKTYISAPPGHMPYYQDVVGNKRTLEALYKYCKTLKKPANQTSSNSQALVN